MDEDVAAFWAMRQADEPGERALFRAVIVQAFNDACRPAGRWRDADTQDEADEWLRFSEMFALYASLAGVDDPEALRERIVARLDAAAQARQNRHGEAISWARVPEYLLGGKTLLTAFCLR